MTIEEAISKYHWIRLGEDGVVEMFLDHHMLSTFRQCEASFELQMMANIRSKTKSWNLEFGIVFHKAIEEFYKRKRDEVFDLDIWLGDCMTYWNNAKLEEQFSEHKMYKVLGGPFGFIAMMGQYSQHFASEVDRLRPIGIEITFGKKKECFLGEFNTFEIIIDYLVPTSCVKVRCYLTGRIDFLMDSGFAIGPLDHKTSAFIRDNPTNSYDPQEGMTGYVFATQQILKSQFSELLSNRRCDRIWMNFAQITPDKDATKRFKRVPIFKTEWQLEQYRVRQLRTFHKIYDMVMLGERPDWNAAMCNNMFHSECQFRNLHRQNTSSAMLNILKSDFIVAPAWNPEKMEE